MPLVAIDPGLRGCGVALFRDGLLAWAGYITNPIKRGDTLDAVASMARALADAVERPLQGWDGFRTPALRDLDIVAERMEVYSRHEGKNPNNLIPLAAIVGGFAALRGAACTWYLPKEWKGQMPKGAAFEARVRGRLDDTERSNIVSAGNLSHNIWDAIGLGLHHLGRFERKRVYPR